jgi:hypothetical protein
VTRGIASTAGILVAPCARLPAGRRRAVAFCLAGGGVRCVRRRQSRPRVGAGKKGQDFTAGYADGVLDVTIPASPKARARRVEITHAVGGSRTISGSTAEQGEPPAVGSSAGGG